MGRGDGSRGQGWDAEMGKRDRDGTTGRENGTEMGRLDGKTGRGWDHTETGTRMGDGRRTDWGADGGVAGNCHSFAKH